MSPKPYTTYVIRNSVSGKLYIGATQDWHHRSRVHLATLRRGAHICNELQQDWTANPEQYEFLVLHYGPESVEK